MRLAVRIAGLLDLLRDSVQRVAKHTATPTNPDDAGRRRLGQTKAFGAPVDGVGTATAACIRSTWRESVIGSISIMSARVAWWSGS